jgi:hypothetical protein
LDAGADVVGSFDLQNHCLLLRRGLPAGAANRV